MSDVKENLSVFRFDGFKVRTAGPVDAPMFVAKDVCDVLGLKNASVVVAALDEDERSKLNLGRQGMTNMVTESGLYHLIFKSRKVAAKKFRRWVTDEVLPSLRREGFYSVLAQRDLITLPQWLEVQGVDVSKNKREAKRLLKKAWDASKLMGYRGKRMDEDSGLVMFPDEVLSLAADQGDLDLEASEDPFGVAAVLLGLVEGREYSVEDMAVELGVGGSGQGMRCRVGKLLKPFFGRAVGDGVFIRGGNQRRVYFMVVKQGGGEL